MHHIFKTRNQMMKVSLASRQVKTPPLKAEQTIVGLISKCSQLQMVASISKS